MGIPALSVGDDLAGIPDTLRDNTPLWFYVLYEAEKICDGKQFGPLGSLVVAEIILGLLQGDKTSPESVPERIFSPHTSFEQSGVLFLRVQYLPVSPNSLMPQNELYS